MLARIRAEAEKRGDEWLRQLLPSQQDQPPTTPTRRSRRSRPPSRLSPSPPTRRRRPASPSPQPSTSGSPGLQRATRRSRIPAGTPPSGRQEPATPTGRARSGGSSARRRSRGPGAAREDHVEEASDAEEGVPGRIGTPGTSRRLRGQASNGPGGSQEDRSATRAGQGDAPGPREGGGARRRGQETRMAGAPMQGGAPAVSFTPERVGGTATAQTAWGTAPQAAGTTEGRLGAGGPATGGAWAYSHDPDTRGGTAAAQAAWGRPGADTAANSWGAGGPAGATQGGPTPAGLPGCGPPTPSRPAGAGLGQATGDMMEGTRAVPGNAAAGWEGTTAALTVAAQGMPPPLCIPQVYRSESGGAATAQHPRGTSQETTGRDSAISNHNDSAVGQISISSARSRTGGRAMPRHRLESGISGMIEWVRRSVAPTTWSSYNRIWKEWFQLEQEMGGSETELDRLGLLAWQLSKDFSDNVSASAVEKKLAALAFLFKLRGWADLTKEFAIKQAVKGFKKGKRPIDHRRPITFNILGGLFNQLGELANSPFELVLFRLAFSWAFFGAFRISELVSHNKAGGGGILRQDVSRLDGSVAIILRDSKTDKKGTGFRVELFGIEGHHTCPVRCFDNYYRVRPDHQGSLLVHQDGASLSRYQFIAVLKKALQGLHLAAKEYGSLSFRIGAATEAARWGLGADVIRRIGRWESNRFQTYVRPNRVER
ncbi:hypothetical protein XENTR_v10016542 [Xenopus tropicalis]|nr:hypothetical protein XENTR_v10016542 [Xenopus tropicalis]